MSDELKALTALRRFGLGPRRGDIARLRADPRGALIEEMARPAAIRLDDPSLPGSQSALARNAAYQRAVTRARETRAPPPDVAAPMNVALRGPQRPAAPAMPAGMASGMAPDMASPSMGAPSMAGPAAKAPAPDNLVYEQEIAARLVRARSAEVGFTERLVMFWANHFAIALKDAPVRITAGAFEREAIRPHVLGRFPDMLRAVEQHPAMLAYLDNTQSIGPRSNAALKNRRGLNENLARETLELHTLGVDGGYTQADVTALARIITGWTIASADEDAFNGGRFTFAPARHEPGDQTLLGRVYPEGGVEQGESALLSLAAHPATARHIARKFAAHFVADDPPPALVDRLAASFRTSGGDLKELARTLIESPEAWADAPAKLRSPQEFLFAALRLTGKPDEAKVAAGQLVAMGQPVWNPGSPKGFADRSDDWLSPTGIKTRLDVADQIGRTAATAEPLELADAAFGGAVSAETLQAVRRAESRPQAIALLLMSPEFQRR
ncbi:uncharacterized protein (DUF1800 family) [Angulomicrobium tetraedrale]|uniref:Uncharacterized protein (DUF1800 family) n=1 Tax=Ancylobacter tetraedralis TaxID=217068 RepID=A0A839Z8E7_9HYPH|nr:DUF1800 domain-containing protein [Ancylobacter tetraedralis]MBB3769687.1 uncharacterized protein (DUF1800 family) [Ancylobacter tetraedralis]